MTSLIDAIYYAQQRELRIQGHIEEAQFDHHPRQIMACLGPPHCWLKGDAVDRAQDKNCPWCEVIRVDDEGRVHRKPMARC